MIISWLENKMPIYDYDMKTHPIGEGGVLINLGEVNEGIIKRGVFDLYPHHTQIDKEELQFVTLTNREQRQKIARKINFNWAGKGGVKEIGKASSAFLYVQKNKLLIDYLIENSTHIRDNAPVLHDCLRQHVDYSKPEIKILLSGHIAPLNITTRQVGWLMSLDAFSGKNVKNEHNALSVITNTLIANRIIPITTDGYPII